ncbi:MAG: hypothetical protein KAI53_01435 [Candidatus Aenigmarchaeota archaeon]|nr:hypothetical protein [Candidatus Aenigmarchaeota archaeon]
MAKNNVKALDNFRKQVCDLTNKSYEPSNDKNTPSVKRSLEYHALQAETKFRLDAFQYVEPAPAKK